jgi:hypothetical protein
MDSTTWRAWVAEGQLLAAWHHSYIVAFWVSDTVTFIAIGDFVISPGSATPPFLYRLRSAAAARFTAFRLLLS